MESLSVSIPTLLKLTYDKMFLPGEAYPVEGSSWYLGVYSWTRYVKWRWDGFPTRVHIVSVTPSFKAKLNAYLYVCQAQVSHIKQ
jgi:hypothetical protein